MTSLRLAKTSEWPIVADITRIANDQYASVMDKQFWQNYEQSTRTLLLTDTDVIRLVAELDGKLVGSVVYCQPYERVLNGKLVKNPYPEMRLLSVLPEYRNLGIANALIEACEEKARSENSETMTLHTTLQMAVAQRMYERRGYTRYEQIDFEPAPGLTILGYIKNLKNGEVKYAS